MSSQIATHDACRICLQAARSDQQEPTNIFEQASELFPLAEALTVICGLNVTADDGYPEVLCPSCLSQLEVAFNLRLLAQRSQEILSSFLSDEIKSEPPEECTTVEDVVLPADTVADMEFIDESVTVKSEDEEDPPKLPPQILSCCGCEKSYDREKLLRRHSNRIHRPEKLEPYSKEGMVRCHVCYQEVREEDWTAHRAGKNSVDWMECDFCKCTFNSSEGMSTHLEKYHADGLYKCCGCDFSSEVKSELEAHSLDHKKAIPEGTTDQTEETYHKCSLCYAELGSFDEKRNHNRRPYCIRKLKPRRKKERSYRNSTKNARVNRNPKSEIEEIDQHMEPPSSKAPACCGCLTVFRSFAQLKEHQQQTHRASDLDAKEKRLPYECQACFRRFARKSSYRNHVDMIFVANRKFRCAECPATRRTIPKVVEHLTTHTGPRAFLCCGCQEGFPSKEELKQHSLAVHAVRPKFYHDEDYEQNRPFLCEICYRRYRTSLDLIHHQQLVYDAKDHTCEVCGKCFHNARTLDLHMATHVDQANHPCPTCGKKYRHKTLAHYCMVRHQRPTEHRCRFCQALFSDSSNLNSHLISHSDARRYKCHVCGETFKRPGHLRTHNDTAHTQERNLRCRYCSKHLSTPSSLKRHEISHNGKFPYRCEFCDKPFNRRKYYVDHYETHIEHSDKVYCCHLCEDRYSKQHFLSNHLKFTHRIEPTEVGWNAKFEQGAAADNVEQLDEEMEEGDETEEV